MLYGISFLFVLLIFPTSVFAQQTELERGIELFDKGDFRGAITLLKDSGDAGGLYRLGLAFEKINETGKAKEAFKKAFVKSYDNFFAGIQEWQKIENGAGKRKFFALLQEYKGSIEIGLSAAEKAYALKSDIFQSNEARVKANVLLDAVNLAKAQDDVSSPAGSPNQNFKITEKPRAAYPKDSSGAPIGRFNTRQGKTIVVTLFTVFGADGKIKLLMPMDKIIDAFTVESLRATQNIKINPAVENNRTVAYAVNIQYSFAMG